MRGYPLILERIKRIRPTDLSLAAVTLAEIWYGIEKSPLKKKERRKKIDRICFMLEIHPFDESAAARYGSLRAQLEKKGVPISERDLQIAAIALSRGLCLVTHNTKEFNRVEKLEVEDWAIG
jgi:tRNA(fMet)-specific endonuclease VapC